MATLQGNTIQNWNAALTYTFKIANNQLTINTTKLTIKTLSGFTATSKVWNSARSGTTFTVEVIENGVTTATWNLTGQSWTIGPGQTKTINFEKNKIINAGVSAKSVQLKVAVKYNSYTSQNTITISLPAVPKRTITFAQGTSNLTPPTAIETIGNWTVPNKVMTRTSTSTTYAMTTEVSSYDFKGWSTLSTVTNGNVTYLPNTSYVAPASNLTLYPGYLQIITTYQSAIISFNKGSVSTASGLPGQLRDNTSIIIGNNITFTIPNNIPTSSGKILTHWQDSSGRIYHPLDTITGQSGMEIVLYAQWVSDSATLTLNTTGGNAVNNPTITYSSALFLSMTPIREGYLFIGWAKEPGGTVLWEVGDMFKNSNSLFNTENDQVIPDGYTLYAVWDESYKTMTYNANGTVEEPATLDNVPQTENMYYSKNYYITDKTPIRTGYQFLGWSTNSSATTPTYYERDMFKAANVIGANTTLYAIWRSNTITHAEIIYNANGGNLKTIVTPQQINYTDAAYISSVVPEKTGYFFQGWHSITDDNEYAPGEQYKEANTPAIRTTLMAIWEIAEDIYIGINNKAQQVSNIYIGDVNNTAQSVIAIYIGDSNGKAKKLL